MRKSLLISIVNYKSSFWLLKLLDNLEQVQNIEDVDFHLGVIDNASDDPQVEQLQKRVQELNKRYKSTQFYQSNKNLGFGHGHNYVFEAYIQQHKEAPTYFAVLNPDTGHPPEVFTHLIKFLNSNKEVGVVSPAMLEPDGKEHPLCRRFPTALSELETYAEVGIISRILKNHSVIYSTPKNTVNFPEWVPAAFVLFRADVYSKIKGFSKEYFLYFEDIDICKKIINEGHKVATYPFVTVTHIMGTSTGVTGSSSSSSRRPHYWFQSRKTYHLHDAGFLGLCIRNIAALVGLFLHSLKLFILRKKSTQPKNFLIDFLKNSIILFMLIGLTSCSSKMKGYNTSNQSSSSTSNDNSDSALLAKMLADKQTENRIKKLQSSLYRSPADEAELAVLKKGGSQREAFLASKKYNKGLRDIEADELKYLEEGKSTREAELRAKEDNRRLNLFEKEELNKIKYGDKVPTDPPPPAPDTYNHK